MNEFKVGILAIITVISVVYMSLKITANQSGFGEYQNYKTIIEDASGIFPKTAIKVAGINAGRILRIELKGNKAHIDFEVLKEIKVSKGSILKIKSVGFLGDKYLEISLSESLEILPSGSIIESDLGGGLEKIFAEASTAVEDIRHITQSLRETIAPQGAESPISQILGNVKDLTKDLKQVSETLKKVITGNEEKLNNVINNFDAFSQSLADNFDKNNPEGAMSDVKEILSNAKQLSNDLKDIVADIKSGKGTMGKFLVEEEIADEVKNTLASVNKIVGKVDAIRTELSVFSGYNSENGAETEAGLKIYPSPERFYLLGVSTSKFGPAREKETTTSINGGVETKTTEKLVEKDTYRFNVQLGRKVHDFAFRGGLIESSGGLGVDYFVNSWNTSFSLDIYDYRKDIGVNVRFYTDFQIWNVIYARLLAGDLFYKPNYTIGAGLQFNDEDLKGLIGFFF